MRIITTLLIVHQHPRILLGVKKKGFGAGKWNGFGGKVEEGETIEEAMRREAYEEAGIEVPRAERRGIIQFEFVDGRDAIEMHIFYADEFFGKPKETDEMAPRWFDVSAIPFEAMWEDDRYWIPLFLEAKKFKGKFIFDVNDHMVEKSLEEVEEV